MMMQSEMMQENRMMSMASAPKQKATTQIGGKKRLNDKVSSKLYKMSKF